MALSQRLGFKGLGFKVCHGRARKRYFLATRLCRVHRTAADRMRAGQGRAGQPTEVGGP